MNPFTANACHKISLGLLSMMMLVLIPACSKKDHHTVQPPPGHPPVEEMLSTLKDFGYDTNDIKVMNEHFFFSDDMGLSFDNFSKQKEYMESLPKKGRGNFVGSLHYNTVLGSMIREIKITDQTNNPTWHTAIVEAIEAWNNISPNSAIHFTLVPYVPGEGYLNTANFVEQTAYNGPNQEFGFGYSEMPCAGRITTRIVLLKNSTSDAANPSERMNAVAHLLGHAIGFSHIGSNSVIPGTNPNPPEPEKSVMWHENHKWNGFSADEILGAELVYPNKTSDMAVKIRVPRIMNIGTEYQWEVDVTGGQPPYRYSWDQTNDGGRLWRPCYYPSAASFRAKLKDAGVYEQKLDAEYRVMVSDKKGNKGFATYEIANGTVMNKAIKLTGPETATNGAPVRYTATLGPDPEWQSNPLDKSKFTWQYSTDGITWKDLTPSNPAATDVYDGTMPTGKDLHILVTYRGHFYSRTNSGMVITSNSN